MTSSRQKEPCRTTDCLRNLCASGADSIYSVCVLFAFCFVFYLVFYLSLDKSIQYSSKIDGLLDVKASSASLQRVSIEEARMY